MPCSLFISHLLSHSQLLGLLTEGKAAVDKFLATVTVTLSDAIQQAYASHATFH